MTFRRQMLRRCTIRAVLVASALTLAAGCSSDPDDSSPTRPLSERATEGREIANNNGCAGCHGTDGDGGVGPSWVGLAGSEVTLADKTTITADSRYLHRAISDPTADVVDGFTIQMPENSLTDEERAAVVAYIEELA